MISVLRSPHLVNIDEAKNENEVLNLFKHIRDTFLYRLANKQKVNLVNLELG